MSISVKSVEFFRLDMFTRFPFRYGIASMTEVPHLFARVTIECDGRTSVGMSADGLPPKWFTKNPDTSFEDDDLPAMLRVIRHAADVSTELRAQPNVFVWWKQLYELQMSWAQEQQLAPLLAGLGASLLERAVLDAFCRAHETTLFAALRDNTMEVNLGDVRESLSSMTPRDALPSAPLSRVRLRHTVGLGDPLTDADVPAGGELNDGLPYTLVENIRAYDLKYFKVKLTGQLDVDAERLTRLAAIIDEEVGTSARFTLDGNEQFTSIAAFRDEWEALRSISVVKDFFDRSLLFVEQPLHRSRTFSDDVQPELSAWSNAPPIIIDESDADLGSLPTALQLGYSGTSHKNCKGVIKGLAARATIEQQRTSGKDAILSAEDLGNVGPVALLQDLAVVASLGIDHVERNGHHYFKGLSMYPPDEQARVARTHADLYRQRDDQIVVLAPRSGSLELQTVNTAPFGMAEHPDVEQFERWQF